MGRFCLLYRNGNKTHTAYDSSFSLFWSTYFHERKLIFLKRSLAHAQNGGNMKGFPIFWHLPVEVFLSLEYLPYLFKTVSLYIVPGSS